VRPLSTPPLSSECQAHLPLEIPLNRGPRKSRSALAGNLAERCCGADREIRGIELRMIQDVRGIHSDRQLLALRQLNGLLNVPIQEECAEGGQRAVPERSDFSRFGIHQYIDHRCSIRQYSGARSAGRDLLSQRV